MNRGKANVSNGGFVRQSPHENILTCEGYAAKKAELLRRTRGIEDVAHISKRKIVLTAVIPKLIFRIQCYFWQQPSPAITYIPFGFQINPIPTGV